MNFITSTLFPDAHSIKDGYLLWFPKLQKNESIVSKWNDSAVIPIEKISHEIFDDTEDCLHGVVNVYDHTSLESVLDDVVNDCEVRKLHLSLPECLQNASQLDLFAKFSEKCEFNIYDHMKWLDDGLYFTGNIDSLTEIDLFEVHPYKKSTNM